MSTFTYSPTDSVTVAPNGDLSVTDGATTTTYSKSGSTKTITKTPPDPNPPPPENAISTTPKTNGDIIQRYTDLAGTTTNITFHPNGNVDIEISKGQEKTQIEIDGTTGKRRRKTWTPPAAEPAWTNDAPTGTSGAPY